ncbi:hypothetical protein BBJ28_00016236 [Nothophytophthora sp. Chile5]|nr:hypothetical protein BBJ28_00016236 [Nothophytophthora sp. Chile5]
MHRAGSPEVRAPASASAPVPASALGASASSSAFSSGLRKVRLSDRELFQRVQRVAVPSGIVNLRGLSPRRGWKRVRSGVGGGMDVYARTLRIATSEPPYQTKQCQVVASGEMRARASELMALLRAPTESESNSVLRALFGSRFIYSSLLHALPGSERGSLPSPPPGDIIATAAAAAGQQLMVRTASFVHSGIFPVSNPFSHRSLPVESDSTTDSAATRARPPSHQHQKLKNEQMCFIELLTPTREGFKLAFCSLDPADVMAGKAPVEQVTALHPITGWLTAEPVSSDPGSLRITFQAAFPGHQPGSCTARMAKARLLFFAKGVCRLQKVLRSRRRHRHQQVTTPGRLLQAVLNPLRGLGVGGSIQLDDDAGDTHHNWHCIACTRSFFPALRKRWRRCDLCAYRVCAEPPCCSHERVAIYNRYVAPLLVCARCRECIDERESDHRGSAGHVGGGTGDVRYTGVGLRFADRESELEPELELDPTGRNHDRWGASTMGISRASGGGASRRKRRTQSDPPAMLGLAFSSSGEDNSSSGAEPAPGGRGYE